MRHRVSRCLLFALLAAFSAVPAAAGPIGPTDIGDFYFCPDTDDECAPFQYFVLQNDAVGDLAGLIFSGLIQTVEEIEDAGGVTSFEYKTYGLTQFDWDGVPGPDPLSSSLSSDGFLITDSLLVSPFAPGIQYSLLLSIHNSGLFPGSLNLSNLLYDFDDNGVRSTSLKADIIYTEGAPASVTEAPSWLVVVIGLGALAAGRALLS